MRKSTITLLLALATILPVAAQQTRVLTADKHNEYGLVYSLPVTSLRFEVTMHHTINVAGPYRQYAKKYIGTDRVISRDSETWEIVSVKALTYGTPNRQENYLMQLKPGATTYICVDSDGMLRAINKEIEAVSLPEPASDALMGKRPDIDEYLQYVSEDFLASQSMLKQAQMLSESLMEIRDAKIALTRGTAETMPADGRQLELMLASLAHQEGTLTAAFTGISASETIVRTFTFTPDKEGEYVLFRLNPATGPVDASDLSGEPIYVDIEITDEPQLPTDAKGETKKLPKDAVIYNIPGTALVTLSYRGATLMSLESEFAQYGIQFGVAPTLFTDKKEPSFAIFNPVTGALEQIGNAQ